MNERDDQQALEERVILVALGEQGRTALAGRSDEETLLRLYTETLGMLPYGLDPAAPAAGLRDRILAAAAGDETQDVSAPIPARPAPARPVSRAMAVPVPRRRWPLALAAALSFLLLGLSGWLFVQLEEQKAETVRLRAGLERLETLRAEQAALQEELATLRGNLTLVGAPGVEACPLRPAGEAPRQPLARGTLFVAADHQHWYLALHGLRPAPAGRVYQLWFVTDAQAISGGTFDVARGAPAELRSETMPAGTRAAMITLEPAGGMPRPTGPEILFGDQVTVL